MFINQILLKCFQDAAKTDQGDQVCLVCSQTMEPGGKGTYKCTPPQGLPMQIPG